MNQLEKRYNTISPLAAILSVAATFLLSLFLGAAFYVWFGYAFTLIFGELLLIVIPLSYMIYKRVDIRTYIGLEVKPKTLLFGVVLGGLLFLFDLFISAVLTSFFGVSEVVEETNSLLLNMSDSLQGLLSLTISLSLAGVCEEFTFRAFMQNALENRYSSGVAIIVSSLSFGLLHFDPQGVYIIAGFLMGLALGYIYHRWQSYVVSAVTHSTLNLIVLATILLI